MLMSVSKAHTSVPRTALTPYDNPTFAGAQAFGDYGTIEVSLETWTYTLHQTAVQHLEDGDSLVDNVVLTADDGTEQPIAITIDGASDPLLGAPALVAATEDGETVTGRLSVTDADLAYPLWTTGHYPVALADGQQLEVYIENDGTHNWLLVGRGREGWQFDHDGQGTAAEVSDPSTLGTTAAFAPAIYSDAVINELITRSGANLTDIEIRIKRAANPQGISYSEMRWRPTTETAWRSNFDIAMDVELEMVATGDIQGGQIGTNATANTRDSLLGGNDGDRIFTWHWASHGTKGFSYGNDVTNGANNDTSFLYENADEQHAIPYTELYIRLRDPQDELLDSIVDKTIHGVVYQLEGEVAGLAVDPDGSYSFDPAVAAYQALAAGENQRGHR